MRIRLSWPAGTATATLRDTPTSRALLAALPVRARAGTWGEEVYFELPFDADPELGRARHRRRRHGRLLAGRELPGGALRPDPDLAGHRMPPGLGRQPDGEARP
nr:cyclophilin-like family protein [Longimycelium tulufanense]